MTIEAAATGLANLEAHVPINAGTVFEVGSVSKQFIGAGIALLAARGRLDPGDPIRKWLPELPALYGGITIAMLTHHTSGIRSWNNLAELTGRGEDSTDYDNGWVLSAIARQQRLNNRPGVEYLYSNSNFVLAAIIIERASGQPLNDFYRDALFARLGMTHTRWRTDFREIVPGRAQAYLPNDRGSWQLDMPLNGVAGAGGLLSTVDDLQRWNAALATPAAADRVWVGALLRPGQLTNGTTLSYGMGIETAPVSGAPAYAHAGSTGSYRAWLGYFPYQRLSIALLCNSGAVNTEDLGPHVAARFLPQVDVAPIASPATTKVPDDVGGRFRNRANDAVVEGTVDASGLHLNGGPGFGRIDGDHLATADGAVPPCFAIPATRSRASRLRAWVTRPSPWNGPSRGRLRRLNCAGSSANTKARKSPACSRLKWQVQGWPGAILPEHRIRWSRSIRTPSRLPKRPGRCASFAAPAASCA